jgi:hypothetical protein
LKLPAGFCATVFADNIGHARHIVVVPNGILYANTWSGSYYGNDTPHPGGFLVALQDKSGSGKASVIVRYSLSGDSIVPNSPPDTILVDLGTATNSCQLKNRTLKVARRPTMHGTRDPRGHLALRRQQDEPNFFNG